MLAEYVGAAEEEGWRKFCAKGVLNGLEVGILKSPIAMFPMSALGRMGSYQLSP